MRALLQRVSHASVTVDGNVADQIGQGLLVLLGVGQDDSEVQVKTLADKIVHLRIFGDDEGKMNRSLVCRYAQGSPSQLYRCCPTLLS